MVCKQINFVCCNVLLVKSSERCLFFTCLTCRHYNMLNLNNDVNSELHLTKRNN